MNANLKAEMTETAPAASETIRVASDADKATQLARELRFDQEDLEANRAGHFSPRQDYFMRVRRSQSMGIGVAALLGLAFVATLLIFMGSREQGSIILLIIGLGVSICNAVLMGTFVRYWLRLSADIREDRVDVSRGPLARVIKPVSRRVMNYMIRVGDAEVFVSREAFEIFEHQATYILYRAPHTGTLLSAERVSPETPA